MRIFIRYAAFTVYALCLMSLIGAAGLSVYTGFCYLCLTTAGMAIYAGTSYLEGYRKAYMKGFRDGLDVSRNANNVKAMRT